MNRETHQLHYLQEKVRILEQAVKLLLFTEPEFYEEEKEEIRILFEELE